MGFFDSMFGKSQAQPTGPNQQTPAKIMFAGNSVAAKAIFSDVQETKGGVFEALLLSSIYTIMSVQHEAAKILPDFGKQYSDRLGEYAQANGIIPLLPADYADFVNNRFQFYGRMSPQINQEIMSKVVYNFFVNPLKMEGGFCEDLGLLLSSTPKVRQLFAAADENRQMVYNSLRR